MSERRPYSFTVTRSEAESIGFVGGRYEWSDKLGPFVARAESEAEEAGAVNPEAVTVRLAEHEAWMLAEAFDADTEGGHGMFPMLARCELREKLTAFRESII